MSNIMVDLETMGSESNAAIVSIGAVQFDSEGLGEEFYARVDLKSSVDAGGVMNPDTLKWWFGQSDEARAELFGKDTVSLFCALRDFSRFVRSPTEAKIWGNGASFDNVILGNAYDSVSLKRPWNFWNDRCFRTMKGMFPDIGVSYEPPTVAHHALSDAKAQAVHLVRIMQFARVGGAMASLQALRPGRRQNKLYPFRPLKS